MRRRARLTLLAMAALPLIASCGSFNRYDGGLSDGPIDFDGSDAMQSDGVDNDVNTTHDDRGDTDGDTDGGSVTDCAPREAGVVCGACSTGYTCDHLGRCCTESVSNIGVGDFTVALAIVTAASRFSTIASQRSICDTSPLWEILLLSDGRVYVATDDSTPSALADITSTVTVNDNVRHEIVVTRRHQQLSLTIDGSPAPSVHSSAALGTLSCLHIESGDPCEPPGGMLFPLMTGSVSDFCLQAY